MVVNLGYLRSYAIIIGVLVCYQVRLSTLTVNRCSEGKRLGKDGLCQDINECEEGGIQTCGQLCTNTDGTYHCSCLPGYRLESDRWSCFVEEPPPVFLLSYANNIATMFATGSDFVQFGQSDGLIKSCDYDLTNERAYWIDSTFNAIYTSFLNGSNIQVLSRPIGKLGDIAVDWIHNKLYWTVSDRGLIVRSDLDGRNRVILITVDQYSPVAIVVDPLKRNIYWVEWGVQSRILSATLDGSNPIIILETDLNRPISLTIDVVDKRLFWMDNGTRKIESANLKGYGRKVIKDYLSKDLIGLSVFVDQLFWTEIGTTHVQRANKYTGQVAEVHVDVTGLDIKPVCLQIMHSVQQPITDPLAGFNCTDNLSCMAAKPVSVVTRPFILFSNTQSIHRVGFGGWDYHTVVNGDMEEVLALDYDPRDDIVYFADASLKKIERVKSNGSERELVRQLNIERVEGLAVDWMHRKLCWTDSVKLWIACSSLSGETMNIIASNMIDKPRGIAIHPVLNLVYWTDWGEVPRIEAAKLFGSERVTIIGDTIIWPYSLTIDFERQKLVWVDSGRQTVEMANLDGTGRTMISEHGVHRPWSVAQFGSYVWVTEEERGQIIRMDMETGLNQLILSGIGNTPKGLQIVHPKKHDIDDVDPCLVFNGGCEQVCFEAAHNQAACLCEVDYKLKTDMYSCALDECSTGQNNCDSLALCTDTETSYTCHCPEGYYGDGEICIDLNPCSRRNGDCSQMCTHVLFSEVHCRCWQGYSLMDDGRSCIVDRNPCQINNGGCQQICINNNLNQVFCSCETGFDLREDGNTCMEDECLTGNNNCDSAAVCDDTDESYECICLEGYAGDGIICNEIGQFVFPWFTESQEIPQVIRTTTSPPVTSPEVTTMMTGTRYKMPTATKHNTYTAVTIYTTPVKHPDKGHIGFEPNGGTMPSWVLRGTGRPTEFGPNEQFVNCPVNFDYYCLHGGDCFFSKNSNRAKCLCPSGYMGDRCQLLDPTWETPANDTGNSRNLFVIAAGVIALFIVLFLILLMFLYCYRLRKQKTIQQPEDVPLQIRHGSLPMQPNPCNPNTYAAGLATETAELDARKVRTLGDCRRIGRRPNDDHYAHIEEDSNHYMIPRPPSNASYSSISTLSASSSRINPYAETVTQVPLMNQYTETDGLYAASSFMSGHPSYVPMTSSQTGTRKAQTLGRKDLASYMSMEGRPLSQHEYWVTINRNGKLDHVYYNSKDKKEWTH